MAKRLCCLVFAIVSALGGPASAQDMPRGQIIDDVQCKENALQHYSLYLPSNFRPDRKWPVIFAFDAGGRGRRAIDRYQAAAEKYGYIVAGSNNSRNGPWDVSLEAAQAMSADVAARFPLDSKRVYTAGMSGGARVALMLALNPDIINGRFGPDIAGVLASSAGFPPDEFRDTVNFPIFGTAGTEDFNHQEMRELDRSVKSPHRVEVFEGVHEWLLVELASEGVEWMEIQAMKSDLRLRDQNLIDDIFGRRLARADTEKSSLRKMRELNSMVQDFQVFKDVARLRQRAAALARQQDVKDALEAERDEEAREVQATTQVFELLAQINSGGGFARLKARVTPLLEQAKAAENSANRRIARRVLASLNASARSVGKPELQELLNQIRSALGGR